MSKNINLDKFYTPKGTAATCMSILFKTLEEYEIEPSEYIEPSAGNGSFLGFIDCISYDIKPECDGIIQADYLSLEIEYKKGRVIFGNPPFGDRNNLSRSFYKKSILVADVIAFIQPISQLNNIDSMYKFDLVKSIDLGTLEYSGMKLQSCFNIYLRPKNGLNKKEKVESDLFTVYRDDQNGYENIKEDLCLTRRGMGSCGEERFEDKNTQSYKIVVNDKSKVDYVREKILSFPWRTFKKHQSAPSISKKDIYRLFI